MLKGNYSRAAGWNRAWQGRFLVAWEIFAWNLWNFWNFDKNTCLVYTKRAKDCRQSMIRTICCGDSRLYRF